MKKSLFLVFFLFLFQIINAKAFFHSKEIKYVCEGKKGDKRLYIFDLKNKKVFFDSRDNQLGTDIKIGNNYFSWDISLNEIVTLDSGQYVMGEKFILNLNKDTKQLHLDLKTVKDGIKYSVRIYNCEKL